MTANFRQTVTFPSGGAEAFGYLAISTQSGTSVEMHIYPAGHSFASEENHLGTDQADSASLARSRTVDFLRGTLST